MPVFVLCVWHCSKGAVSLSCCVSNLLPPQGMWVRWCPHHPHHHPDHHPLQSHLVQLKEEMFHCCGAAPPPQVQYPCAADSSPRFHGLLLLLTLFFGENKMDWIGWEGGWADPRDEESARVVPGVKLRAQRGWREQLWLLLGAWLAGGVVTSLCPPRNLPPAPLEPLGRFLALCFGKVGAAWRGVQLFTQRRHRVLRTFQTLLPVTAFTCKVLMAPWEEKRKPESPGCAWNCSLSITENYPGKQGHRKLGRAGCSGWKAWGRWWKFTFSPLSKLVQPPSQTRVRIHHPFPWQQVLWKQTINLSPCAFFFFNLIPVFAGAAPRPGRAILRLCT